MLFSKMEKYVKNKIIIDFVLNLLASLISTGILQIVVYPLLAFYFDKEQYGFILTGMAIASMIIVTCGNSLNNVRLLLHSEYKKKNIIGDFNYVIVVSSFFGSIIVFVALSLLKCYCFIECILLSFYVFVGAIRSYAVVHYRIVLDYKKNLLCCIFCALGSLVGLVIVYLTNEFTLWPMAFLFGEVIGLLYVVRSTSVLSESFSKTVLFMSVIKKETVVMVSSLSANFLTYLDRLLLMPLLGGQAVSVYTVSSFFGKSIGLLMAPMAGVLLSHYAQEEFKMNKKVFWKTNGIVFLFGVLSLVIAAILSKSITGFMYPTIIQDAKSYLLIANVTAIINICGNMIMPAILKFAPIGWQVIIQVIYCLIYLIGGIVEVKQGGLWGFCKVALFAAFVRLVIIVFVGTTNIERGK